MPMQRDLYPGNWEAIALAVKDEANWTCEECGKPCRKPDVDWMDFVMWLLQENGGVDGWYSATRDDDQDGNPVERPQRFTLTVAHLDHRPGHCDLSNLRALCAPCHCRYDNRPEQWAIKSDSSKNAWVN